MSPKPQTRPADGAKSRAKLIESITTLVQETVDPDSWRDLGGTVGSGLFSGYAALTFNGNGPGESSLMAAFVSPE